MYCTCTSATRKLGVLIRIIVACTYRCNACVLYNDVHVHCSICRYSTIASTFIIIMLYVVQFSEITSCINVFIDRL